MKIQKIKPEKKTIIPTVEKLKKFATRFVDDEATCEEKIKNWKYAVSYAEVFRLLFLLGLRISEALDLQRHEVRFTDCTLYIRSKNNKNRIVAFDEGLARLLREYDNAMEQQIPQRPYFFQEMLKEDLQWNHLKNGSSASGKNVLKIVVKVI